MKIRYTAGPPTVTMGAAGVFEVNKYRDVPEDVAAAILAKTSLPWEAEAASGGQVKAKVEVKKTAQVLP